jgi:hypothetical protein
LRFRAALVLSFLLVLFGAFSCRQRTEEDAVLGLFDTLTRLAERKDISAMMAFFAADFKDFEGRDKEGLRVLLTGYLSGRTGIVVHALSRRISGLDVDRAVLDADVAISSGGAAALRRLIRISPDIYRIRAGLTKGGERWQISSAEWSWISLADLLPESLSAFKKLFPNL